MPFEIRTKLYSAENLLRLRAMVAAWIATVQSNPGSFPEFYSKGIVGLGKQFLMEITEEIDEIAEAEDDDLAKIRRTMMLNIVYDEAGESQGFALIAQDEGTHHLQFLFVSPESVLTRAHLGTLLIRHVVEQVLAAEGDGCLHVNAAGPSVDFYRKLGFIVGDAGEEENLTLERQAAEVLVKLSASSTAGMLAAMHGLEPAVAAVPATPAAVASGGAGGELKEDQITAGVADEVDATSTAASLGAGK